MPEIPDASPAIGSEWQRTRAAYTTITDRIVDLAKAGGGRKSPAVRQAFAAVDAALTEMQHAAHAYRDAMAKVAAERDALADAIHQAWARSTSEPDPSAAPADLVRRLGEFGDDWKERAKKAEAGAAVVALVAAYGDADTLDHRDRAAARIAALTVERNALARFKAYVHTRLDAAGVPTDPDSPHKAEGCRIGGRLDWIIGRHNRGAVLLDECGKAGIGHTAHCTALDVLDAHRCRCGTDELVARVDAYLASAKGGGA